MIDGLRCERYWADRTVVGGVTTQPPAVSLVLQIPHDAGPDAGSSIVDSVLAQSHGDFELIVVDDGCAQSTQQRLAELQSRDPRVTLVLHRTVSGLPALRLNEGLTLARGSMIAYPAVGAPWERDALATLIAELSSVAPRRGGARAAARPWATDPIALLGGERIPLSSILHWRDTLENVGGFDPHIVARNGYDRDFIVRLGQVGPFAHLTRTAGSAAAPTGPADASVPGELLSRRRFMINRRDALALGAIGGLAIDALDWIGDQDERDNVYHRHIAPFLAVFHGVLLAPEPVVTLPLLPRPRTVAVTKTDFSTSVDVTLGNFCRVLPPSLFNAAFIAERELAHVPHDDASTLILYRTVSGAASQALVDARRAGITTLYLMDDNMLRFGTGYLAAEHGYLAPGTPMHDEIRRQLSDVDLVVTYTKHLADQCREITPRVVTLETNILDHYVRGASVASHSKDDRIRIAMLSGKARARELKRLWPAFAEFASRHADQIEFHFWGMDPEDFGSLACPVSFRPFENTLYAYLDALSRTRFHFAVCPLDDDHETKLAKSPVKYLEITAAGGVGVYSNASAYRVVRDRVSGIKVEDDDWIDALEACLRMPDSKRREIHATAKADILERFTTESQVADFLTAFEAADLHRKLSSVAPGPRNPAIGYFAHESLLGGATLHLLMHARIAKRWGFTPCFFMREKAPAPEFLEIVEREGFALETDVPFVVSAKPRSVDDNDRSRAAFIHTRLEARRIALVHSTTVIEEVGLAAKTLGVPLVRSLHKHPDSPLTPLPPATASSATEAAKPFGGDVVHSSSLRYAREWSATLNAPAYCLRAPMPAAHFERFAARGSRSWPREPHFLISGTIQRRKRQLTAIEAVGILALRGKTVRLTCLGYAHLDPEYVLECRNAIATLGLAEIVSIEGFERDPLDRYADTDALLCASVAESMPQSILKSMAMGVPIVTTDVGGVGEVVKDGYSAIIARGDDAHALAEAMGRCMDLSNEERQAMLLRAYQTASMICREDAVALGLMRIYSEAADRAKMRRSVAGRLV